MFKALQPGDSVGVVALSNFTEPDWLEPGIEAIAQGGFNPVVHPHALLRHGRFAGTDMQRLQSLHDMYGDASIKAIICARGGYGVPRFIDGVDFDLIRANPKPLIGYSDTSLLLNAIHTQTGQPGLHGTMLNDFRHKPQRSPETWDHLLKLLRGEDMQPTDHPACSQAEVMVTGEAEGVLRGGNLAVLQACFSTRSRIDYSDCLLVIEEVGEDLYRFDRMMGHFARAGVFAAVKGIIMGELVDVRDMGEPTFGQSAREIVEDYVADLGVPVVWNFPCGHGVHRTVLPLGGKARLVAGPAGISIRHDRIFA